MKWIYQAQVIMTNYRQIDIASEHRLHIDDVYAEAIKQAVFEFGNADKIDVVNAGGYAVEQSA